MYSFKGGCCRSGEFCYILSELFDLRSMCAEDTNRDDHKVSGGRDFGVNEFNWILY